MVKDLIGRRRKGMGYMRTHMGQMLHERPIFEKVFQNGSSSTLRCVKRGACFACSIADCLPLLRS
jgi:hypothetical protein